MLANTGFINCLNFALLLMCSVNPVLSASFKFTSIKCQDHDEAFSRFQTCKLAVQSSGLNSLNVHVNLYKTPVTNTSMNVALYKRTNGYQPYMLNISADVCAFFENRKKYPIVNLAYSNFIKYSNVNHSCPFDHDIIIKDLVSDESVLKLVPIPSGDYLLKSKIYAYNDLKATMDIYATRG